MATATKKKTGFQVPCPKCGAIEGLRVKTHDLTIECVECSEDITVIDLDCMIGHVKALIKWVELAPSIE